jgi:hypothetical protein
MMKTQIAKLLKRHQHALAQKGLDTPDSLLQAVRLDMVKSYSVLAEVHERSAEGVVREFFAEDHDIIAHILPHLDQTNLHHLGFQVHEPHDLILPGFYRWLPHFSEWLKVSLQVNGTLRFPSSINFQERVGAYTEMMQIWVEMAGCELLIEMFGIYKPRDNGWPPVKKMLAFSHWADWCQKEQNPVNLPKLLAGDDIWHYGIHVRDTAAVNTLDIHLQQFITDKAQYKLVYDQPVHNPHDNSFHIKIRNQKLGLEIEFLTQNLGEAPRALGEKREPQRRGQ